MIVGVVNVAVLPEHIRLGPDMLTAGSGVGLDVGVNAYAALVPHAFTALTDTEALPLPAVRVIEFVVLDPLQPVPLTVHIYDVAPGTAVVEYTAVAPTHGGVGLLIDEGSAGPAA